jgi:hypothetical protein
MSNVVKSVQNIVQKVVSWFIDIPDIPDTPDVEEIRGTQINKQSNNAQIPVIYGERLVGGTRVFLETSGTDNTYLYGAMVLSEGEINAITEIQVNESVVTFDGSFADGTQITSNDSKYGTTITLQPFYGTDGQSAASLLTTLSNWTTNHKLSGIAYIAFRFTWDSDKYTGIPNIKVKVQGKKISTFDSGGNETTGVYSTNPVWCLLDFLRNERYGKGISDSDLDISSFYAASQIAETQVTPYSGGSDINLFDCNAVINTNKKILDNVKVFLKGMRGLLPYVQGKFKLLIETTGTATFTLNEDNIIGGIKVESERKNEKYNRVIVNWVNPDKSFQVDSIVYPETDAEHQTLKTADGGFLQEGNVTLDTITSPYQALEFGKIILNRSRDNLKLGLDVNYEGLDLAIGDIVNVTSSILGMTNKPFRVSGMTLNADFTASLSLQEHQDSWYTFDEKTEVAAIGNTNFPDPFSIEAPSSLTLTDEMVEYNDGSVLTRLSATIGASTDQFVAEYEVEAKQTLDKEGNAVTDQFRVIGRGAALEYSLLNAIDNATYEVRARAINSIGVKSTYVTATRQIIGQTAVPSDVTNFSINVVGDQAILGWTAIPDLDLDYYQLRFSTDLSTPSWLNSFDLVDKIGRPATSITVPLKSGSYLIKAVDKLGNQSANETIVTTNIESVNYVADATINEHTGFTGTKTDVSLVNISGTNYIGLTATGTVGTPATRVPASGIYEFANTIDVGAKLKVNFTASVSQFTQDVSEFFDGGRPDSATLIDDGRPSPFDGASGGNAHTLLEVATSDDDVTYSAFSQFVVGEYIGRYFKFRVLFESDDLKARSLISSLSVSSSIPTSGTGGKTVTYTYPFKVNPALGISAQSMANGDYYVISSKSTSQFTIEFFNSSDTSIDRTFDYIAEGVGQVIT